MDERIEKVKSFLESRYRKLVKKDIPLVIAGLGMCDIMLLTYSLMPKRCRNKTDYKVFYDVGNSLYKDVYKKDGIYKKGVIYKVYGYPNHRKHSNNVKVIFMFGNIYDTVITTEESINKFRIGHFRHLKADNCRLYEDIYYKDVLSLEKLFDSWYRPQKFPLMTLRYETLYNNDTIEKMRYFLGFKPDFKPVKTRTVDYTTHPKKEIMQKVYKNLHEKIKQAEDAKTWNVLSC